MSNCWFSGSQLAVSRAARCDPYRNHVLLLQAGVHYIEGRATVKDEHTVHINGKDYTVSAGDIP